MKLNSTSTRDRLGWRMPIYATLAAVLVFLPLLKSSNVDVLYLFVIVPALVLGAICVLIYAVFQKKLWLALMAVVFCAVSSVLFAYSFQIRTFTRWLLWSGQYKNKVLAESTPINGGLKHIEWDGWGWGGQGFSVFLVFDPTDSLSEAAQKNQSGRLSGITCEVSGVRRIESHWYIVFFDGYVDQSSWDRCG